MTKIKIYLYGTVSCCLFNMQTISAEIEDEDETYIAHFGTDENEKTVGQQFCCRNSIILYSDKSLALFKDSYRKQFSVELTASTFSPLKNCSDSVNYALDFFFPRDESICINKPCLDNYCDGGKVVCACGLPGLLVGCLPPPPYMNTPQFVFNKALLLAHSYGKPIKDEKSALLDAAAPVKQYMT